MNSTELSHEIYREISQRKQAAYIANKLAIMEAGNELKNDYYEIQVSFMVLLGYEALDYTPYWTWKKNKSLEEFGKPIIAYYMKKLERFLCENS